jgi:RNA recognition motif-containing protein
MSRDRSRGRDRSRDDDRGREPVANTIFIGGISRQVRDDDIRDSFKEFGPISNIKLKGEYAFVTYDSVGDADRSVKEMDGVRVGGHKITVQKSYGGRKERDKGPVGADVCYNCGETGHW